MRIVAVSLEHRFFTHEGRLYSRLCHPYPYWSDYLKFFDKVVIVARAKKVDSIDETFVRADGPSVDFVPVPYYVGLVDFLKKLPALCATLFGVARRYPAFIMRSGNVTNVLWLFVILLRRPYLREYPGNVLEGVTGFVGDRPGVRVLATFLDGIARLQGRFARANSFVSVSCKNAYASARPSFVFSSFAISEIAARKESYSSQHTVRIISVGRIESEKGHRFLVEAVAMLEPHGFQLLFIGDGTQRKSVEDLCKQLGVNALFLGAITDRAELFERICDADIFVLPSLTEGMPRALLEAMAVGLPCIGSNVGGIPEILPEDSLVKAGDSADLSEKIRAFAANESLRSQLGLRNRLLVEERYSAESMASEKRQFWQTLYK